MLSISMPRSLSLLASDPELKPLATALAVAATPPASATGTSGSCGSARALRTAILQNNNFIDNFFNGNHEITASTRSAPISRRDAASSGRSSGSNSNSRIFSSLCALSWGISFVTILFGIVVSGLPNSSTIGIDDESELISRASRRLLDASFTLQCIAHSLFFVCVLVEHSTWLVSLAPATGTHWKLRIGRNMTALQSSFRARHANDIALACTTISSNIWLIASSHAENSLSFQFVALALCGPTCAYAILREIHSASALLAWTLSCVSVAMNLWLVGDSVDAPTCVTAVVALGIIARIKSLEQECLLLRNHRSPMLAADVATAKFLAERESTALATKVAAATEMAAMRASVAQAESIAAETRANAVRARQEGDALARVIAQAKSDSEIAVERRESESLTQELSTSKEGNIRLEIAFLRSEKQMLESNSSQLRALMGNVAHDLKTPLQAIAMGIELLRYVRSCRRARVNLTIYFFSPQSFLAFQPQSSSCSSYAEIPCIILYIIFA